jgi:hypothetical protein
MPFSGKDFIVREQFICAWKIKLFAAEIKFFRSGACVFGDKRYSSAPDEATILSETGVSIISNRRKNMARYEWADEFDLRRYRKGIETVNSQLEKMGVTREDGRAAFARTYQRRLCS